MKCRGKINVKGKGSMVTYFLQRKNQSDDDDILTHQSSRITAPSEEYEICEIDDQMNVDHARLTEKRKSLCRQHNIFSSLTNKSVASESMVDSIEFSDDTAIPNEKTKLLDKSSAKSSNTSVSPETYLKSIYKPNLPSHCATLKDSIESLEKLLKNDYSLADINSIKLISTQPQFTKFSTESGDTNSTSYCSNETTQKLLIKDECAMKKTESIDEKTVETNKRNGEKTKLPSATTSKPSDESLIKVIKNKIKLHDVGLMKISKSLYPFNKEQSNQNPKMPTSKSLHYFSTHNQNGSILL